jgi:transcriptional regulator with XRE-family HTH domain
MREAVMARKKSSKKMETSGRPPKKSGYTHRIPHTRCRLFARNVKFIINHVGFSENKFSQRLGLKQPYVNKLLNGKFEPRLGTVLTIAEALGAPIDTLLSPQHHVVERFAEALKKSLETEEEPLAIAQ